MVWYEDNERSVAFIGALVHWFPVLRPVLKESICDNHGEVLPHFVMARITDVLIARYLTEGGGDELLRQILDALEVAYYNDVREFPPPAHQQVAEVIAFAFLEHLPRGTEPGSGIRSLLGPELSKESRRIG